MRLLEENGIFEEKAMQIDRRIGVSVKVLRALTLMLSVAATAAWAVDFDRKVNFVIAAQPLASALMDFSRQAQIQVMSTDMALGERKAVALNGRYSIRDALGTLLKGTDFAYSSAGPHTVAIVQVAEPAVKTDAAVNEAHPDLRLAHSEVSADSSNSQSTAPAEEKAAQLSQTDEELTEVVVTAQKREERLQDVPISISVMRGMDLDRATVQGVTDALSRLPALRISEDVYNGGITIGIRGIGNNIARYGGAGPVAYYVDSIPFGFVRTALYPDASSNDLQRIEVLAGPQGTLYGANALNGVVRVITEDANADHFEFKTFTSLSTTEKGGTNYGANVAVNVPLIQDKLGVRLSVGYVDDSGWIDSPVRENVNRSTRTNYRLKLHAQPTDTLSVDLLAWRTSTDDGAPPLSFGDYRITVLSDEYQISDFDVYGIRINKQFDGFSVQSMSSWLDYKSGGVLEGTPAGTPATLYTPFDAKVFSQELNFISTGDGPMHWSAGGFYRDATDDNYRFLQFIGPLAFLGGFPTEDFVDTSTTKAVFGEIGRRFGTLDVSAGLRYFHDDQNLLARKSYGSNIPAGSNFSTTSEAYTPRVVLTWTPAFHRTYYASYAQGFRSGFAQLPSIQQLFPNYTPAQPDRLTNYEIGVKGSLFQGFLNYEAAVFYIDWQEAQVTKAESIGPINAFVVLNVDQTRGPGASFTLSTRPVKGLSANLSVSGQRLKTKSRTVEVSDQNDHSVSGGAQYVFPLGKGFTGQLELNGIYTPAPVIIGAETNAGKDFRARFSISARQHWRASIFANNLTSEDEGLYIPTTLPVSLREWSAYPKPRTIGVQFEYQF